MALVNEDLSNTINPQFNSVHKRSTSSKPRHINTNNLVLNRSFQTRTRGSKKSKRSGAMPPSSKHLRKMVRRYSNKKQWGQRSSKVENRAPASLKKYLKKMT